jgi:uncharacterized membrane protein HdeD (DUF308 family)
MAGGFHVVGLEELRRNWGWCVALGVCLVILGMIALGSPWMMTLTTAVAVQLFGYLLIVGGILQAVYGMWERRWGGFFLDLIAGLLDLVVGFFIVTHPLQAEVVLTLFVAIWLILGGLFRIVVALTVPFRHRVWLGISGVITLVLGGMIFSRWPSDAPWVIGLFIGIDLLFRGWALVMLGLSVRSAVPGPA